MTARRAPSRLQDFADWAPPRTGIICFTWDDNFDSQYTHVLPAAQARGQRHTFYVCLDQLDAAGYMTSAQLLAVSQAGHEIGAHSVTHPQMSTLTPAQRIPEWDDSKAGIEAIIGAGRCNHWAYPQDNRNATTDAEGYLRYRTLRSVAYGNGHDLPYPLIGVPAFRMHALDWQVTSHAFVLAMIRRVANSRHVLNIYAHSIDGASDYGPTNAQMLEAFDLAQSLRIPCLTVEDVHGSAALQPFNGGFEDGMNGWAIDPASANITAVLDTPATALSGSYSAKMTHDGSGGAAKYLSQRLPLWAFGQLHTLSGRYRIVDRGGTGNIVARGYGLDHVEAASGVATSPALTATTWTAFTLDFTASSTARLLGFEFELPGTRNADLYIDHVHVGPKGSGVFG